MVLAGSETDWPKAGHDSLPWAGPRRTPPRGTEIFFFSYSSPQLRRRPGPHTHPTGTDLAPTRPLARRASGPTPCPSPTHPTPHKVQSTEYKVQSTKYKVQSTKYRVQSTKSRSPQDVLEELSPSCAGRPETTIYGHLGSTNVVSGSPAASCENSSRKSCSPPPPLQWGVGVGAGG